MPDYSKMYFDLFNRVTDALQELKKANYGSAAELLIRAQQEGEEAYLSAEDNVVGESDSQKG